MGLAIARLAEEQMEFDSRIGATEDRLDQAAIVVGGLTERVSRLEESSSPLENVSDEQASQISQAVKAVAMKMSEESGRNEYGGVYGELYRRFGITSYKLLPTRRFREAMDWLTEWFQSVAGAEAHF